MLACSIKDLGPAGAQGLKASPPVVVDDQNHGPDLLGQLQGRVRQGQAAAGQVRYREDQDGASEGFRSIFRLGVSVSGRMAGIGRLRVN